uniref:Uncharacterized protein n=1 Tax=Steinernema glaseri TaxID=37863 RepID=A0A1I7YNK1_9BILA
MFARYRMSYDHSTLPIVDQLAFRLKHLPIQRPDLFMGRANFRPFADALFIRRRQITGGGAFLYPKVVGTDKGGGMDRKHLWIQPTRSDTRLLDGKATKAKGFEPATPPQRRQPEGLMSNMSSFYSSPCRVVYGALPSVAASKPTCGIIGPVMVNHRFCLHPARLHELSVAEQKEPLKSCCTHPASLMYHEYDSKSASGTSEGVMSNMSKPNRTKSFEPGSTLKN